MNEIWLPVEGYEEFYEVSSLGRIRSLDRVFIDKCGNEKHLTGRILKQNHGTNGYLSVQFSVNDVKQRRMVHRVVAKAFIPNPENLPEVNHKDEDKYNNRIDNLEWCDRHYNNCYGTKIRRSMSKMRHPIEALKDGIVVATFRSQLDAAKITGNSQGNIWRALNESGATCGGYEWREVIK